ncbi:methyltransferase family protein [Pseudorhodoplanes sinuspersici]|nr:isoprenylcysteine carboxylmethyltransferase family protein [Pseudorhodoplanes sinuspersici]RKE68397.1 protein-S-isoprenylcysteine O-methyltransferase Ste14 [Pseudorhodoplanes sinuspersici]
MSKRELVSLERSNISGVESVRKMILLIAVFAGAVILAVSESAYPSDSAAHDAFGWLGLSLIIACILGRTWSSLYVAGRKTVELVTDGPYSIMRNPLYFFSILGTAGIGALGRSIMLTLVGACVGSLVFWMVTQQEERRLLERHGQPYAEYLRLVPRFLPNLRLWRDTETLTIRQSRVLMTFADALLFLMAVPLIAACRSLQLEGLLPVLVSLP